MKKEYAKPNMEIVSFAVCDVITTSIAVSPDNIQRENTIKTIKY